MLQVDTEKLIKHAVDPNAIAEVERLREEARLARTNGNSVNAED